MKFLVRIGKLLAGLYFLVLLTLFVIIPSSPIIGLLLLLKHVEAYLYNYFYKAKVVSNYDFIKLSTNVNKSLRTTLILVNGTVELKDIKELVVSSLIDAHTSDGYLCFPNLTKRLSSGLFNNYWVEEDGFDLNDHVMKYGTENVYTNTELEQILACQPKSFPSHTSPWFFTLIPLQFNKTALLFSCHPVLDDVVLLRSFLKNHVDCNHPTRENLLFDYGYIQFFKNLCLSSWNVIGLILHTVKSKNIKRPESLSISRRFIRWSKPIDIKVCEEIIKHLKVDVRSIILGSIAHVLSNVQTRKKKLPLHLLDEHSSKLVYNTFTFNCHEYDPVSTVNKNKENYDELIESGQMFSFVLLNQVMYWLLPARLARYIKATTLSDARINISTLLADEKAMISNEEVAMVSIFGEGANESQFEISITNSLNQLIVATEASESHQEHSVLLLKEFEQVVSRLAESADVFTHYYR